MGKKILCMLLCVMCICPLIANAAPEVKAVDVMQREFTYELPRGGAAPRAEIDISAVRTAELPYASVFSNEDTEENHREAERIIRAAALNNQTTATVPYSLISDLLVNKYVFSNWWELVIRNNPDLLFERVGFSIGYKSTEVYIQLNYIFETTELDGARAKWNSKVNEIVNGIRELGLTKTEDICLYVHEYLAENVSYQTDHPGTDENEYFPTDYSSYGAFVLGECVCQGYAEAAKAILDRFGIENILSSDDGINHVWNTVKIDGEWYNMDITWDDPVKLINADGSSSVPPKEFVAHDEFLISDSAKQTIISENSDKSSTFLAERKVYYPDKEIACTDTRYERYCATNGTNRAAEYISGKWKTNNYSNRLYSFYYTRLTDNVMALSAFSSNGEALDFCVKIHSREPEKLALIVKGLSDEMLKSIRIYDVSSITGEEYANFSILTFQGGIPDTVGDGSGTVYLWDPDTLRPLCAPVSVIKN